MLDCERQAMKSLSKEQLIYLIEDLLRIQKRISTYCSEVTKEHMCSDEAVFHIRARLYEIPTINSMTINNKTLPAYIDMQLGKITDEELICLHKKLCRYNDGEDINVPTEWCKSTYKCPHFNDDDVSFWLYADIDDIMDYIKIKNNVTNT